MSVSAVEAPLAWSDTGQQRRVRLSSWAHLAGFLLEAAAVAVVVVVAAVDDHTWPETDDWQG